MYAGEVAVDSSFYDADYGHAISLINRCIGAGARSRAWYNSIQ